jgi:hypothetical protein
MPHGTSCQLLLSNGLLLSNVLKDYRLENWGARRAALSPYFFRSFMRASRVNNPAFFNVGRRFGSTRRSARAIP